MWRSMSCHAARLGIFLIMAALLAGTVGCGSFVQLLTIDSTDGWSVIRPGEGTFRYFASMCCASDKLVAEADEGYRFVEWTGEGTLPDNPDVATTWVMVPPGDSFITAHFWPECTPMVTAGGLHTVGLKDNGRVFAVGDKSYGRCSVSNWRGITRVAAGASHTVVVKTDGTAAAVGDNSQGQCDISGWNGIKETAPGALHTVGLKSDGTAVAVGDIVQVAVGGYHMVGLRSNGTVVATGVHGFSESANHWTNIVQVAAGEDHTVGLRSDGTVVAGGNNESGQCDVADWTDITQVDASSCYTVGLKSDGTIVAAGCDGYNTGPCYVGWMLVS